MINDTQDFSGYKTVWIIAMFDLPVVTFEEKKAYAVFRKKLIQRGFIKLQFSVYGRFYPSEAASIADRKYIRSILPLKGQVRLITITDRQFEKMDVYFGKRKDSSEKKPEQLMIF